MNFEQTKEFQKELKRFSKKYKSLPSDLKIFQKLVEKLDMLQMQYFFEGKRATKLIVEKKYEVIKARLDCESLGNKQMLRIIYIKKANSVLFIELYAKNVKNREDNFRIKKYSSYLQ